MLKLRTVEEVVLTQRVNYRLHAKKAMFESDPTQKEFHNELARRAMERAEGLQETKFK